MREIRLKVKVKVKVKPKLIVTIIKKQKEEALIRRFEKARKK
jgi:hypothetical protein